MTRRTSELRTTRNLTQLNVILPLCIGVLASLYALYRPMPKFAALLAASKRIEAEEWKFRMRAGQYRAERTEIFLK